MDFACAFSENLFLRVDSHLLPRHQNHCEPIKEENTIPELEEEQKIAEPEKEEAILLPVIEAPMEPEEEKKAPPKPAKKEFVPMCRGLCHPLKKRNMNNPKVRYSNYHLTEQINYNEFLVCNLCDQRIEDDFYLTCDESCDYDTCFKCWTCSGGNRLVYDDLSDRPAGFRPNCERCPRFHRRNVWFKCSCPFDDHFVCGDCLNQE